MSNGHEWHQGCRPKGPPSLGINDVNTEQQMELFWFQLHENSQSIINTGPDGLQRLDYVVQSAEVMELSWLSTLSTTGTIMVEWLIYYSYGGNALLVYYICLYRKHIRDT